MKKEEIEYAIKETLTSSEAAKFLNLSRHQLWKYATQYGIELKKNQGGKGLSKKRTTGNGKISLKHILEGKHPTYKTNHLKRRLIDEGIKTNKCEECSITEWNGKPIICELDHINGNSKDHKLTNLRILCPNCHSQTDTYCRKKVL